jgi:hypothetical protein
VINRSSCARPVCQEGTAGTFVGCKVGDYLIIASDKQHVIVRAARDKPGHHKA